MTNLKAIAVQHFSVAPDAVYAALLDPAFIRRFLFGDLLREEEILSIDIDAKKGGAFSYKVRRGHDVIDHIGKFVELSPPNRMVFTWAIAGAGGDPSTVEIDIAPDGDGSKLTLTQTLTPEWADYVERSQGAWQKMMLTLAALLDPPPHSRFVYVTYIRTTPEKLWEALTAPEFTRQWWCETWQDCAWVKGATWTAYAPDGRVADAGEVLEIDAPHRAVFTWRNEFVPGMQEEGHSRVTYDLEVVGASVKLTLTHEIGVQKSKLIDAVSQGWPHLMASLKSFLETGAPLVETTKWPEGM